MFKRLYYDSYHNKIYHWYVGEDGKTYKEVVTPPIEYYVPDPTNKSNIKSIYGKPVKLQTSKYVKDMRNLSKYGIETSETDIPMDTKFLQKKYQGKILQADMSNINVCTIDIEVESEHEMPLTSEAKYPINVLTVHFSKTNEVYTFGIRDYTGDSPLVKNYYYCPDEANMLKKFIRFFRKQKVDILTGWYSDLFDIPYFINRCKNLNITTTISPVDKYISKTVMDKYKELIECYSIAGIAILDGLSLYIKFERDKRERYTLNAIGVLEVQEGKLDFEGQINDLWKRDWNLYVEYNVQDVLLTRKIEEKKQYIELAVNFCYQALIPFDRIFSSIALITGYITKYLHNKNMVLPDSPHEKKTEKFPGAYVMAKPGFYKHIISFDVASMYPHMIMQYGISPETVCIDPQFPENYTKCPISEYKTWDTTRGDFRIGGVYYDKEKKGVLAEIVGDIFKDRKEFKLKKFIAKERESKRDIDSKFNDILEEIIDEGGTSQYYDSQQYIRKILINSMYGVLGNPHFVFYNLNNAIAVTLSGQDLIKYLSNTVNNYLRDNWHTVIKRVFPEYGNNINTDPLKKDVVILIDTDSNYISLDEIIDKLNITFKDDNEFREWVLKLEKKFFNGFFDKILDIYASRYGVDNIIDFKREKIIKRKLILAKKKYADQVIDKEGEVFNPPKIDITGIEIVRTDTPSFCRERIQHVLDAIFSSDGKDREMVINTMKEIYTDFKETSLTDIAIPKGVSGYTKYAEPVEHYLEHGITYVSRCPKHVRASINYNYIIKKHNFPLIPISNGTKMKFVHVYKHNELKQDVIGFVGNWPKEFDDLFDINYDFQWERSFQSVIQRFFDILDWGNISLDTNDLSDLFVF